MKGGILGGARLPPCELGRIIGATHGICCSGTRLQPCRGRPLAVGNRTAGAVRHCKILTRAPAEHSDTHYRKSHPIPSFY